MSINILFEVTLFTFTVLSGYVSNAKFLSINWRFSIMYYYSSECFIKLIRHFTHDYVQQSNKQCAFTENSEVSRYGY